MVRFPLGGAYRCRCGWAGPFHQPQGLEGVVIQTLLGEKTLCGVQQQQVLPHKDRERTSNVHVKFNDDDPSWKILRRFLVKVNKTQQRLFFRQNKHGVLGKPGNSALAIN